MVVSQMLSIIKVYGRALYHESPFKPGDGGTRKPLTFYEDFEKMVSTMYSRGYMVILQNPERASWQRAPNPYGDLCLQPRSSLWCLGG
jgi:hypothetical protein